MAHEPTAREQRIADVFIALSDTLVSNFDVVDLFDYLAHACVELLDVTAAGLMLADASGRLRVVSASDEQSRLLELLEIQNDSGPCLECYRSGRPVHVDDLDDRHTQWPELRSAAAHVGIAAIYALPMRLRADTIGALNLFQVQPRATSTRVLQLGQALADIATIAILQQRSVQRTTDLADQLHSALNTRLAIEQAKGVLAEREQIDVAAAFEMMRGFARRTGRKLADVATSVVRGELDSDDLSSLNAGGHRPESDL